MSEGWQNRWGMMRLADFRARKTLREVRPADLPEARGRSAAFREIAAEFRRQVRPGDVLYHYDSLPEEWDRGFGSEGYALVRDGELVDTLVLRMN